MTRVSPLAGADLWAESYDLNLNPLLALEVRTLGPRIAASGIRSLFDAGCGTGRWMTWAEARGIPFCGVDGSRQMLLRAESKPDLRGRCAQAMLTRLPVRSKTFDVVICSFALSYVQDPDAALSEFSRIASRVLVSDLHPAAEAAGWKRAFRTANGSYVLDHFSHSTECLDHAASAAGLKLSWRVDAHFDEPERGFFIAAGKAAEFDALSATPAILATLWEQA